VVTKEVTKLEKLACTPGICAELLSIHVNTVYSLIHSGRLPAIKLGRKYLISLKELQNWLAKPQDGGTNS